MDKYERMILAIIIIAISSAALYLLLLISGYIETKFPFGILIPSWLIIFIPIINQKRLEAKKEQKGIRKERWRSC
jgi:hypothetical protein